jgi:hypothetical protein
VSGLHVNLPMELTVVRVWRQRCPEAAAGALSVPGHSAVGGAPATPPASRFPRSVFPAGSVPPGRTFRESRPSSVSAFAATAALVRPARRSEQCTRRPSPATREAADASWFSSSSEAFESRQQTTCRWKGRSACVPRGSSVSTKTLSVVAPAPATSMTPLVVPLNPVCPSVAMNAHVVMSRLNFTE